MREPSVIPGALAVDEHALAQGDAVALAAAMVSLAAGWFGRCGSSIALRHDLVVLDAVMQPDPERRALLAAACDLVDLLSMAPQGRELLRQLGCECAEVEFGFTRGLEAADDEVRLHAWRAHWKTCPSALQGREPAAPGGPSGERTR